MRRGREVVSSEVINQSCQQAKFVHCIATHDTSSVLRDILYHYYIIVVGRSGPWREEGKIESCQNQFYGTLLSCDK